MTRRSGSRRSARVTMPVGNAALRTLLAAPGAVAIFDGSYAPSITKDGSNRVASWASRVGVHTVTQGTDANKPVANVTSPSGRAGLAFASASSQYLLDPLQVLGALFTGATAYSALVVAKFTATTLTQAMWSLGTAASTTHYIYEGTNNGGSNPERVLRFDGGATTNTGTLTHGTNTFCKTTVYTGAAISTWVDGVASSAAAANTRAPAVDTLVVGTRWASAASNNPFGGSMFMLILSTSQWTAGQRQSLEAAARSYWGTP